MRSAPSSWSTVIPWRARAMRHAKRGRKLGREAQHRNLMLGTMAGQVIQHGRIKTTAPKAKEVRGVVDKLINTAKRDDLPARPPRRRRGGGLSGVGHPHNGRAGRPPRENPEGGAPP